MYDGLSTIQDLAMWLVALGFNAVAEVKLTTEGNSHDESSKSGLFHDSPDALELQNKRLSDWESAKLVTKPCSKDPEIFVQVNVMMCVSIPELGFGL